MNVSLCPSWAESYRVGMVLLEWQFHLPISPFDLTNSSSFVWSNSLADRILRTEHVLCPRASHRIPWIEFGHELFSSVLASGCLKMENPQSALAWFARPHPEQKCFTDSTIGLGRSWLLCYCRSALLAESEGTGSWWVPMELRLNTPNYCSVL